MKLREIMNQNFDVRNYMSVGIDEETKEEIERSLVVDIDDINYILASAKIYIDGGSAGHEFRRAEERQALK